MTEKDIQKQLRFAASVVKQWPAWKRNILVHSAQPTNSQSRPPVSNQATNSGRWEAQQKRERLWASPHCLPIDMGDKVTQRELFE